MQATCYCYDHIAYESAIGWPSAWDGGKKILPFFLLKSTGEPLDGKSRTKWKIIIRDVTQYQ